MSKISPIYINPSGGPIQNNSTPTNPEDLVNLAYFQSTSFTKVNTTTTDGTATALATITISNNSVVLISVWISARRTDAADRAGFIRNATVYREAGGGATILSTVDTPLSRKSDNQWDATIDVSGNNARIMVTGRSGRTIDWTGKYITAIAL